MGKFETEFHATAEEVARVVESWMDRFPIFVCAFAFPPEHSVAIARNTIREVVGQPDLKDLAFTETPPNPSWKAVYDAFLCGASVLRFSVGRLTPKGLTQSFLTTNNSTPTWQKMNRELKKLTTAGADLVWEDGRTGFDRNARFTAGAKALAAAGTPLRQWKQSDYVYLPK